MIVVPWARMRERGIKYTPVIDLRDALAGLLEEVTCEELLLRHYVLGTDYQ